MKRILLYIVLTVLGNFLVSQVKAEDVHVKEPILPLSKPKELKVTLKEPASIAETANIKQAKQEIKQPTAYTNVEQIIIDAANKYGIDPNHALRIAQCESGMNPGAINYGYNENGYPSGLFQHLSGYYPARAAKYGYSTDVFDAYSNANVTMAMWAEGQSGLWECR